MTLKLKVNIKSIEFSKVLILGMGHSPHSSKTIIKQSCLQTDNSNALANATFDWITSKICDNIPVRNSLTSFRTSHFVGWSAALCSL